MTQNIPKIMLAATMAGLATTQAQDTIITPVGVTLENQRPNSTSAGPYIQYGSPLGAFWYDGSGLSAGLATGDPVPDPWPTHGAYSTTTISRVRDTGEIPASPTGTASLVFDLGGSHTLSGIALWNSNEAGTNTSTSPASNNTTRGIQNMVLSYSTNGGMTFTAGETLSSWTQNIPGVISPEIKMLTSSVPNVTHVRIVVSSFNPADPIVTFNEIRMISSPLSFNGNLVITQVPETATAGVNFSPGVIVEARDTNDMPLAVSADTVISLSASGTGTLNGNTATILAGQSSVTLNTVNYTKAETITLSASRTSGDSLAPSAASSSITVSPAAASQLIVETAADGTGAPVTARTVYPTNTLTVYSISRDAFGNFIANETATWSLANTTGNIVSGNLVDNTNGSATFTANDLGTTNIRASFSGFPDADSGLITVEELIHRYTGAGGVSSWQIAANWTGSILPNFSGPNSTTDLFFSESTNTKGTPYLGADVTVRSLNFDNNSTPAVFNITFVEGGNVTPANLTFDTDSGTGSAELNVTSAFTKPLTMGGTGSTSNEGVMILVDNLLVTHDGTGSFTINQPITGSGGLTKAGTGTLTLSGANTYDGDTVVNAGTLVINGDSIEDTRKLVINGGIVDVSGNEIVAELFFGANPKADGIYGSTSSSAPVENQDDTRFSGTGTVTVDSSLIPSGFSGWITGTFANGTVPGGLQGPNDDADNDGISNLVEYALDGFDPTASNTAPGSITGLLVTYTKRALAVSNGDVAYAIEESTDLGASDPWQVATPTTNDGSVITYTLTPPAPSKDFVRLRILQP